jgi:hypothetical protein
MSRMIGYALGYNVGRSDEQTANQRRDLVHQILYGERPATVDQSYIDRLHAALATANDASEHNFTTSNEWKQKAQQFKNEALYWREEKYAPAEARAKALCQENAALRDENAAFQNEIAVLLARLKDRNPDLAEEQAAHDETFREKQSLQCFRVIAASLIDALLAGRANRPEFAELLNLAKHAADTIDRGNLFTAFRDEPEKHDRLCSLAEALQKP